MYQRYLWPTRSSCDIPDSEPAYAYLEKRNAVLCKRTTTWEISLWPPYGQKVAIMGRHLMLLQTLAPATTVHGFCCFTPASRRRLCQERSCLVRSRDQHYALRYDSAVLLYLANRQSKFCFDRTPSTLRAAIARKHNIPIFGECDGVGTSSKKMKLDKRQRLMQKKLSGGSALSVLVEKELAQLFFTNSDEGQRGQRGVSFKSLYRGNGL